MPTQRTIEKRRCFIEKNNLSILKNFEDIDVIVYANDDQTIFVIYENNKIKPSYCKSNVYDDKKLEVLDVISKYVKNSKDVKKQKEMNKNRSNIEIGDILVSTYGYDATLVKFYQVVGKVGKCSIKIREIASIKIEDNIMSGFSYPDVDNFVSEEFTKRVNNGVVKINSSIIARKHKKVIEDDGHEYYKSIRYTCN